MTELPPGMQRTSLCVPCSERVANRVKELGLKTCITKDKIVYNPTQVAINMVVARCLEGIGIGMITAGFASNLPDPHKGCPIHFLEANTNEDRSCPCDDPECPSREPGSVVSFYTWLDDPVTGAPTAVAQYMQDEGLR